MLAGVKAYADRWWQYSAIQQGYSSKEAAAAADDAEPGYDPEFWDTHAVLVGYNQGSSIALYDYGSDEAGFWSESRLLEVAWGFPDDYLAGEVFTTTQAQNWENPIYYDRSQTTYSTAMSMVGVTTTGGGSLPTQTAYDVMMSDLAEHSSTAQSGIAYVTFIDY